MYDDNFINDLTEDELDSWLDAIEAGVDFEISEEINYRKENTYHD